MAAALENNGDNNGVDGSRHCCRHVPELFLTRLVSNNVFSLEASAIFASKVIEFLEFLAPRCELTR